jgi:hypothetical protein
MLSNSLLNQIVGIAVQASVTILGVAASYFVSVGVSYINKKKQALIKQIGVDQYNSTYNIAKGVYFAVEQQFKFIPLAGEEKAMEFDKLLLSKVPGLTQEEIDHFREAVVGEINSQVKAANLLAPAYDAGKDEADVKINPGQTQARDNSQVNTAGTIQAVAQ